MMNFSEDPDTGGNLVVEYLNNWDNWIALGTFMGAGTPGEIFTPSWTLPGDDIHTDFRIRFRQTGADYRDYWHIDDVNVAGVFFDNFDDGDLLNWTVVGPLLVQE